MKNLIDDLLLVAMDRKESEQIRLTAMQTVQALRPSKSNEIISKKESQILIDTQMFERLFEVCDSSDPLCQILAAGTISSLIYRDSGYDISRYRVKKLLSDKNCEVLNTGRYTIKLINK